MKSCNVALALIKARMLFLQEKLRNAHVAEQPRERQFHLCVYKKPESTKKRQYSRRVRSEIVITFGPNATAAPVLI